MPSWQVSKRLRCRDWWGVAIDLLILVVGVFLGIQAANWNDGRRDDAAGRAYLLRIRDDLRADVRSLDQHERYWRETTDAGVRTLDYAETRVPRDAWPLLNDMYGAGQSWNYATNDATYSELRSAGRLDLIRDTKLRQRLSDYYVSRRDQVEYLADANSDYRLRIRAAVPYSLQRVLLDQCQGGFVRLFVGPCPPPATNIDIAAVARGIIKDDALMGELRTWMTTLRYMRSIGRERRALAADLIAEIDHSQG